jgi:hypothetical protein
VIGLVPAGAVVPSVALVRVARWLNTLGGPLCFYALIGNGTTVLARPPACPERGFVLVLGLADSSTLFPAHLRDRLHGWPYPYEPQVVSFLHTGETDCVAGHIGFEL